MKYTSYSLVLAALLCLSNNRFFILTSCLSDDPTNSTSSVVDNNLVRPPHQSKKNRHNDRRKQFVADIKTRLSKDHRSRAEATQRRWQRTFKEIKALVAPKQGKIDSTKFFEQWKLLLDRVPIEDGIQGESDENREDDVKTLRKVQLGRELVSDQRNFTKTLRQRFDGFTTWEKRLAAWSDEASMYMSSGSIGELEGNEEDSLSQYERPMDQKYTSHSSVEDDRKYKTNFVPRPVVAGERVIPHTDISDKSKKIWIVTTASLPWMTGTAVNPLLRAAYLTVGRSKVGGKVTLMLPWLELKSDQEKLYGKDRVYSSQEEQEAFIRNWLRDTAKFPSAANDLNIAWYTGRLETLENSVYSMGDITALIPEQKADICILEEPEHLNWYRAPGESWTQKFKHVIGIVHTNYFVYAQDQPAALVRAPAMRLLSSWMCRAHCHRIIKLSGTLGSFAPEKELVENTHGVRQSFLDSGRKLCKVLQSRNGKNDPVFGADAEPTVYFIGKMLWSKGLASLMELMKYAEESAGLKVDIDMYGGGPSLEEAKARSERLGVSMDFHGPVDHAALAETHKIFINPSTSEVLCTTVAEALAMGKFVVLPSHPSNDFFAQFPNCLTYANKEEFVGNLYFALTHSPEPLTTEYSHALSWQAATERLEAAGTISLEESEAIAEAGLEIDLPPLIEDEKTRKQISTTVKRTRSRFRLFRSQLSQEIQQSNVLPKELQQRLVKELDKRLDLDVDTLLGSPKLRLQLSPAELDKRLLEFYNTVSESPSGDVLRVIGGGNNVGRQNYYLKQQALKKKYNKESSQVPPQFIQDEGIGERLTVTKSIKKALERNLQETAFIPKSQLTMKEKDVVDNRGSSTKSEMNMSISVHRRRKFEECKRNELSWRIQSFSGGAIRTNTFQCPKMVSPLI